MRECDRVSRLVVPPARLIDRVHSCDGGGPETNVTQTLLCLSCVFTVRARIVSRCVLAEVISTNKGMIWVCASDALKLETSHNLRVLAAVSRARCCTIPSRDGGEIDAVDARQRCDQCEGKTSRDGVKPRTGKQRIASYNRKESRERVHTDSRGD
jgi:hypothetical protein